MSRESLFEKKWYQETLGHVEAAFNTSGNHGLSTQEAEKRLQKKGLNVLREKHEFSWWVKIYRELKNPLVIILLVASLLTLFLGEYLDAALIFIAVGVNVVISLFQGERASHAFARLNASQEKYAMVIRDGKRLRIHAEYITEGDLVVVEAGQYIPADLRLVTEKNLTVNEAALTGEWVEVSKDTQVRAGNVPLAEQSNMVWRGTFAVSGYATGITTATGIKTEIGKIAESLGNVRERLTPIQLNIRNVARFLVWVMVVSVLLVLVFGVIRDQSLINLIRLGVAIAVAVVPEGLPAAVTVVLALGMEKILQRGGLVKSLLAAETLGSTTIILTDKTGTLTQGNMKVSGIFDGASLQKKDHHPDENLALLETAILASDAFVEAGTIKNGEELDGVVVHGRPIERAIIREGLSKGITQDMLRENKPQVDFLAFESRRPFAASLTKRGKGMYLAISGSPEFLLSHAGHYQAHHRRVKITERARKSFEEFQKKESRTGRRLIGIAYKRVSWKEIPEAHTKEKVEELLEGIVFMGFIAFSDTIRKDVPDSIRLARSAGARVLMLTGDNPETARTIAEEVGIVRSGEAPHVLTGADLEKLSDKELFQSLKTTNVFARVLPAQKLRISHVLKNHGEVVAMTGDGINDAPALRSADIGIAVGSGTDVAKESADLVLLHDSFSVIVYAIEEGRRIIDNLKKILAFLLSTSFGEIYVVIGAFLIGGPLPILPTQILWINIVGGGLISFGFAFEEKEPDIMKRSPRNNTARALLTKELKMLIAIITFITGMLLVSLYFGLLRIGVPIEELRTLMFVGLTINSFLFVFSLKNFRRPVWKTSLFSNKYLMGALVVSIILLIGTFFLEAPRRIFEIVSLTPLEILLLIGFGIVNLASIEVLKYFLFERKHAK